MPTSSSPPTFADALRVAMERNQLTLGEVRDRLAHKGHSVSITALSYWRAGRREPARPASFEAVIELETILDLLPGSLTQLLSGRSARRARRIEPFDRIVDYPMLDPVAGTTTDGDPDITRLATHVTVDIGPHHEIARTHVRRLVVANRDGVDGLTVFTGTDEDGGIDDNIYCAVAGCTVAEVRDVARNVRTVRLQPSRPLRNGESWLSEVEVTQREGAGLHLATAYEIVAQQRLEEATVWIRFDPDAVPTRSWMFFSEAGLTHQWRADTVETASVHHRQRDFGPGFLGISWEW